MLKTQHLYRVGIWVSSIAAVALAAISIYLSQLGSHQSVQALFVGVLTLCCVTALLLWLEGNEWTSLKTEIRDRTTLSDERFNALTAMQLNLSSTETELPAKVRRIFSRQLDLDEQRLLLTDRVPREIVDECDLSPLVEELEAEFEVSLPSLESPYPTLQDVVSWVVNSVREKENS